MEVEKCLRERFGGLPQKPPGWLSADLNNARLASVGIYQDRLPEFRALYEECEQDLQCFYERAEELGN